jgi:hypothetical protein
MRWLLLPLLLLSSCAQPKPSQPVIAFRDIAQESGLRFTHHNGATGQFYMPEIMGSGAALLDYDGDGDLDIFFVQSSGGSNKLFRNDNLRFTDVTHAAGLEHSAFGMGAATGDFNNDGRVDLLVTNFGPNVLYANQGDGTFKPVPFPTSDTWSTSASFFDYDLDGWQDLVVLSYVDFTYKNNKKCFNPAGELDYCTPVAYRPVSARLYHNEQGRFVDVTAQAGLDRAKGPGLGVQAIDANDDGWPDLFVANDTAANHLWINQKNGTFVESALALGVAYAEEGLARAGMGVAAGDFDLDGQEDLIVLNLMREGATLFKRDQAGYRDVSLPTRIHALTFSFTGFGVGWIDADNDGLPDLYLGHGSVTGPFPQRSLLLRNQGPGQPFAEVPTSWPAEVTRGAAFGDINNDGRQDILITNNNGPARLLLNESTPGHWLQVAGLPIGTKVGLERENAPTLWWRIHTDGSYASASSPILHVGLGNSKPRRILFRRPDGSTSSETLIKFDYRLNILPRSMK